MKSTILVVAFACLSLVAAAQSDDKQSDSAKASQVTAPRDIATGQASGKRMHKPVEVQKVSQQDAAAREAATGKATGKKMASDDWQASTAKNSDPKGQNVSAGNVNQDGAADRSKTVPPNSGQGRVAAGDVNGDGMPDVAASKNSGHATEQNAVINNSHSNIKNAREASSGMASGKRQHKDFSAEEPSPKK